VDAGEGKLGLPSVSLESHAHSKTTLDIYAKAATPSKRRAHERIVDGLLAVFDPKVVPANPAEIAIVG
jgi:hypothetical protein